MGDVILTHETPLSLAAGRGCQIAYALSDSPTPGTPAAPGLPHTKPKGQDIPDQLTTGPMHLLNDRLGQWGLAQYLGVVDDVESPSHDRKSRAPPLTRNYTYHVPNSVAKGIVQCRVDMQLLTTHDQRKEPKKCVTLQRPVARPMDHHDSRTPEVLGSTAQPLLYLLLAWAAFRPRPHCWK